MHSVRSCARLLALVLAAVLATGCSVSAMPSAPPSIEPAVSVEPTSTPPPAPTATPAPLSTPTPSAAASTRADLGPEPTIDYPEVQAMGVATLTLTRPAADPVSFWVTCEWSDTSRVSQFIEHGAVEVFGEAVRVYLVPEDPRVDLWRAGERAPYSTDDGTTFVTERSEDWTSGSITFSELPLNPDAYDLGPLPTPKAAFERPLGGRDDAATLDGTVAWACGEMPAAVPTPPPFVSHAPAESTPPLDIPEAVLTVDGESVEGITGCGRSWSLDGQFGGIDSCATTWSPPGDDRVLDVDPGDTLRFHVPEGLVFEEWTLSRATQADSDYWHGLPPPLEVVAKGQGDASIAIEPPPAGEWVLLLSWSGSDDHWEMHGVGDHFRVVVRP